MKLYSTFICCISAVVLLVVSCLAMENVTDLFFSRYKYKSHFAKFASVESFINSKRDKEKITLQNIQPAEVHKRMIKESDAYLQSKKDNAIESLIGKLAWGIVGIFFWVTHFILYHSKKY